MQTAISYLHSMKRQLKKWTKRVTATLVLIAGLLLLIVFNPYISYGRKTTTAHFNIYHKQPLDPSLPATLETARLLLKVSEFNNPDLRFDICLNDGALYPGIVRSIQGDAFAWGFYDKVVVGSTINYREGIAEFHGYRWNLTQLFAHEMTHCLQFDKLGLWKSKPVARIATWKWEGYAEYVSRQGQDQQDLVENIRRLNATDEKEWAVTLADNSISPREYYQYWLLVSYCLDIRKMSYSQLLADTNSEESLYGEMLRWFSTANKRAPAF